MPELSLRVLILFAHPYGERSEVSTPPHGSTFVAMGGLLTLGASTEFSIATMGRLFGTFVDDGV